MDSGFNHTAEMSRLYRLEYGELAELIFRFTAVGLGGVVLYVYAGWTAAWVWVLAFYATHLVYFLFLRRRLNTECSPRDSWIAAILFMTLSVAYAWLPAMLMTEQDEAMRFAGTAALGSFLVFMVRRADLFLPFVFGEILVVSGMVISVLYFVTPRMENGFAVLTVLFTCFAMLLYFAQAMLIARKHRIIAEVAARREQQEAKMAAVGRLAGGVAHEFNNILTVILGNLDLIEQTTDQEQRKVFASEARTSAERAVTLVQQLLVYARQPDAKRNYCDANRVLRSARALCEPLLPNDVVVSVTPWRRELLFEANENDTVTALLSLVKNAAEAMPGGGKVRIAVEPFTVLKPEPLIDGRMLGPGEYVAFDVTDKGHGIAVENLKKVIEPFYTTKRVGEGSGLGLSMVQGFAAKRGGGLQITSSQTGTRVRLFLQAPGMLVPDKSNLK